ncbi:MAG TPA: translocation/assembly module TamB domain-containing protein [Luteibacter sp.]|nr:translocation/assembly module TamB domain-containing protein [Luteibacter sp.]
MKWMIRIAIGIAALSLVVVLGAWWLLGSAPGLRFALARASGFTGGALTVQQADGRLAGPLDLSGIRYADGKGMEVKVARAHLDLRLWPLLRRRAHVLDLDVDGVDVALPKSQPDTEPSGPITLEAPIDMVLDRVHVGHVTIVQDGKPLFASNTLDLAGSWTGKGIELGKLALRAPDGHADLRGTLAIGKDYRGNGKADVAWKIGEVDYAASIEAHSDGVKAHVEAKITLPMLATLDVDLVQSGNFTWTGRIDAPRFDPKPLLGEGSLKSLGLSLKGNGDRYGADLSGGVGLNDYDFLLTPIKARFEHDYGKLTIDELSLGSKQIKGSVKASGVVSLDAKPIDADLKLAWQDLLLPADLAGQDLASQGAVTFRGSAEQYHVDGKVDVGPPGRLAKLALDLDGTPQLITLHSLDLQQAAGGMQAKGTLTLDPQIPDQSMAWQLETNAQKLDPGQLLADWSGSLDFDLATDGVLAKQGPQATLDLRKLEGNLRKRPLRGNGKLTLKPNRVVNGTLDLASGASTVKLEARGDSSNDADLVLSIASLGDWLPDAGGRLEGRFDVHGLWPALAVKGNLQGQNVVYAGQKIDQMQLAADVPDISKPGGRFDLDTGGATVAGMPFDHIRLHANGTAQSHQLNLDANGPELSTALALTGGLKGQAWNGTLSTLNIDLKGLPRWRLQQASQLSWNEGAASLSELCLTAGDPSLCVAAKQDKAGNLDASYRLRRMPLALLATAAGSTDMPVRAEGILEGDGTVRRTAAGALTGQASITSTHGSIAYTDRPDQPLLVYDNLVGNAQLSPENQRITVRAGLNDGGTLDADVGITGAAQALSGQVRMHLKNLAFVELFTAEVAEVKGSLDANFGLAGTVATPAVTGQAVLAGFAAEVPSAGLKLHDGRVVVTTSDAKTFRIDGQLHSGEGQLAVAGVAGIGEGAATELHIGGNQFLAADIPSAKVVISPDMTVKHNADGIDITGKLTLDSADVDVSKLPGAGANKASSDVVVVDEKQQQQAGSALPLTADISVDLGKKTHLVGFGLDGRISGQLDVRERPGRVTTGQGQIRVDGTYKAYGQDLNIEQGQLLFAGTPIDNPGLNIRAARTLNPNATISDGQKVGLYVSGTAARPILTVFSNPVMEQSDALSYLVTGKPLSQVKGGEGNMVGAAAQALGSAAGDLLAKSVGSKIGIDDIGVSNNDALGGTSAFTVGKYLSPKLYLSYGVGLFEPGQVITLRYLFNHRWNFEAQNATDFNRASLNYRYEK